METIKIPFKVTARMTCRICQSPKLQFLYSLGNLFISNFVKSGQSGIKAPLEMLLCRNCTLVQLRHTAPQELLYSRYYWYRSGVTDTMKKALRNITEEIEHLVDFQKGDIVLDIGSNDGTLLRSYQIPGLVKIGFEPAINLKEEGEKGVNIFVNDFWDSKLYLNKVRKKAKVITAIGMFYDMEDPNEFIKDAAGILDEKGIFIAQLMCLKNMIDTNDLGNICHEHLEYYSLAALKYLFNNNNLEIIDISHNNVNGGSYRIFVRPVGGIVEPFEGAHKRLRYYFNQEKKLGTKSVHLDFFKRVETNKKKTVDFIKEQKAKGKRIWAYGASTKGNTILQYFGLDNRLIEGVSDKSPDKWQKETIGTHIPIYSEEAARKANPDYFLVLPYAFINEFRKRERVWLSKGGRFILPLPEFKIVQ